MADITNPEFIAFVNGSVRPIAEKLRDLAAVAEDYLRTVDAVTSLVSGNTGTDKIMDSREAEGISRLILSDITALTALVGQVDTRFQAAGISATIQKPCVRSLLR